ncbi:TMEM165/GDT1 family protein [Rhodococcus aetherivorans]|uniref:TMEM165/GDT1 family protein n=1 Tax=Rhodococcus aetherivorans TaxID=191292 RepID=UPI001639A520|nr:TMEM165/GDT1 family protein [Rhodococcus aetherivorans]MBC2592354.1 TMEM165/GDT1 family protein [Rhodococcus aetherivorans]
MPSAVLLSFAVVFVAELGDKSQLMAMTFALRYRWWVVIAGITVATTVVHLVSVAVGHYLGAALPATAISVVGGMAFLAVGAWTLRGDELSDDEQSKAGRAGRSALLAVSSAFFLAELGDKTMFTTIALATEHDSVGVWIGSTVGMIAADALAIVVGGVLGRHLPDAVIRIGAAVLFLAFGVWLLLDGLVPDSAAGPIASGAVLLLAVLVATGRAVRSRRTADPLHTRGAVEASEDPFGRSGRRGGMTEYHDG